MATSIVETLPLSSLSRDPNTTLDERDLQVNAIARTISHSQTPDNAIAAPVPEDEEYGISKSKGLVVILTLSGMSFINTMGSGILIAALPRLARDVGLSEALILWPAAVYALAAGCLLLIFGAIADILGAKAMWVTGSTLFTLFTMALGLAQTGIQVIMLRACLGIAVSMCLPTAVSLISNTFPRGTWRNVAFAMNGMGQPIGYMCGLVLGGVFTDTIGWRYGYYIMAIINAMISVASIWSLPVVHHPSEKSRKRQLAEDIDWFGAILLSVALGLLLYVLAETSYSYVYVGYPQNFSILIVAILLLVSFPFWMHHRTRQNKPALIPNNIWKNASFTSICIAVFMGWAALNGIQYFSTLYFQQIQKLSALQSSLRFLPHIIMGVSVNLATAYLISRVNIQILAVASGIISAIAPILMATVRVDESYWLAPFWALFLSPTNADVLFTVSNLIISDAFPPELQSLAGGVFNEMSQFGNSVGLAVTAAIAASVTEHSKNTTPLEALMTGYRAAFWTIMAGASVVVFVALFGLRGVGTIGRKRD